jgi:alkanesulfonate monooxygenase SsuD/methylene tetrahydromethanopterin reductase-like flavin-dependent oxidoreductase (luciferase family)
MRDPAAGDTGAGGIFAQDAWRTRPVGFQEEAVMGRGFGLYAGTAPEIIRATAREAEGLGYSSFWVNYPGSIDGLSALALAARETQRIGVGVGVISLDTRGPDSIGQGVRANALPLDRLLLGVGSANRGALGRVRGGIAKLRSQLPVRLVVAALGPQMCRVAGEVADGVLFNWLTPEHARRSAEWVRAAAAAAGRQPPTLFAYVRLSLGPAARDRLLAEAARYAAIPAYAAHFARMEVKPVETAIAAQTPDAIPAALQRWQGAVDEIVLRAITANDTVEEHLALLKAAKP